MGPASLAPLKAAIMAKSIPTTYLLWQNSQTLWGDYAGLFFYIIRTICTDNL